MTIFSELQRAIWIPVAGLYFWLQTKAEVTNTWLVRQTIAAARRAYGDLSVYPELEQMLEQLDCSKKE